MTETAAVLLSLVGGLALFLFGMSLMTDGLRQAVGGGLRILLTLATRNRVRGLVFGALLGLITHSGPAVIMLIGFVNAGLMTLAQAIPPVLGANLGTSLSMQLVALRIGDYCYGVMALGLVLTLVSKRPAVRQSGRTLLGFGLLFLGLNTSSAAIAPHREVLGRLLARVPFERPLGLMVGLLVSVGWTALLQSSGATIGMCFVLVSAGVVSDLRQVFPLVLGAHIGTCLTPLLGSLGMHIEARRVAVGHLVFNVLTVILVIGLAPLVYRALPLLSADLLRQTANLHTCSMLAGVLLFLPLSGAYARLLRALVPSRQPPPQASLLDPGLLEYPEKALCAAIAELQRMARLCARSLRLALGVLVAMRPRDVRLVKLNENVIDEIKLAMKDYLTALTARYLSRRQAILLQHVNRCMADIERIARRNGQVVAIGHPHDRTLEELERWLPTLAGQGLTVAPISAVVLRRQGRG